MSVIRRKFTTSFINSIEAPASGRLEFADEGCTGLYLRVSEHGVKSFTCVFWQRGRTVRRTLGKFPAWSLEAARTKCRTLAAEIATGTDIVEQRRVERAMPTVAELFDAYARNRTDRGKRGMFTARQTVERWITRIPEKGAQGRVKPAGSVDWSNRRLDTITRQDIAVLSERMRAQGLSGATCNRVIGIVRAMFEFGRRTGLYSGANPVDSYEPGATHERTRFLSSAEMPVFLKALEDTPQPWRDFFLVLLLVGYRRAAVAAMRWEHVDLDQCVWHVPVERAKNGELTALPLTGRSLEVLKRRKAESSSPFVFPGRGRDGHITQPKRQWAMLLKRAGLRDLRPHDLRRTFGSWCALSGFSLPQIGKLLGHKSVASTRVYARLELANVAAASAEAQERMFSLAPVIPIGKRA